jgi:peptidase inhibitor I78 family protein
MRNMLLAAAFVLGACTTAPAATPVHGVTPGHKCRTEGTDRFIGQTASEIGAAILRVSHAAVLRWAPPGVMLTMDYREDRVTVHLDAANKVTEINCG